jgi:hypothetical protein
MKKLGKISKISLIWAAFMFGLSTKITLAADYFCDANGNPVKDPVFPNPRVYTALGCIYIEMDKFMEWFLPYLFGIAGGIAFLLMIYGFIRMSTAKGDPKAMQGARETIGSAIAGLLVSVFSLFILRLVAVDILHIPGISK